MRNTEGRTPVVTGVGLVTPAGIEQETAWKRMRAGESCLAEPRRADPESVSDYSVYVTGEIDQFDATEYDEIDGRATGRFAALSVAATMQALEDAELDPEGDAWDDERTGVSISSAFGGLEEVLEEKDDEKSRVSSYLATKALPNLATPYLSRRF